MTDRDLIHDALASVRRRWQIRLGLEGLLRVLLVAVLVILIWALAFHWLGGSGPVVRVVRVAGWLAIVGTLVYHAVRVLRRRPRPDQVALYVEEQASGLAQSLVSAVGVIQETAPPPPEGLVRRVLGAARQGLSTIEFGRRIETPRIRRVGGWLGAVTLGSAALLVFGPQSLRDSTASLVNPWRKLPVVAPFTIAVEPGNAEVPRGGAQEIQAVLGGFTTFLAEVVYRTDSTADWERLPMERDSLAGRFLSRLLDLNRPTEYFVEAEGIRSPVYRLTVVDLPAVSGLVATIDPPAYTGLPDETVDPAADLAVLGGSGVAVRALTTRPAKAAWLIVDGRKTAMRALPDGGWLGNFRVRTDGYYRVDLDSDDGRTIKGLEYTIDALEDSPPSVHFAAPGRDTKVTSVEEVVAEIEAADDFGVSRLDLYLSVNGAPERRIALTDSSARSRKEVAIAHTLFLEEWDLSPGDVVSYYARATDGAGRSGSSDIYFLEVRPFDKTYREAEQSGGGHGGAGGESAEGLSERQRQIVVGTFNVLRDSAGQEARTWRENVTTLAISQGRLVGEVTNLLTRLRARGLVQDTLFRTIATQLDSATTGMRAAEEQLAQQKARQALPEEQKALLHLQRAEAAYREVQVSLGQQQGGGGGASRQASAEELADLFELETDKLRNQYESVQRESGEQAERQLDETLERLRRLASRQQQENERMERMANALRNRSQQSGGGGGSSQRQLAEETEEAARQLERLAREKNSQDLADQARRLREAAEQMRRAATSGAEQGTGQGNEALGRLRAATRELERSRSATRQEEIRRLANRAEELRAKQAEAAAQAQSLPAEGAERSERLDRLSERKDGLAKDVERLSADAQRLARDAARDQPKAAGKLSEAAEGLESSRVRDKLLFSKDLVRRGSPDAIRSFEQQIGQDLAEAAEQLKQAAGSISEAPENRQARALDRARDLVRGLSSLEERARARQREGQSGRGQEKERTGESGARGESDEKRQSGRESAERGREEGRRSGEGQQSGKESGQQSGGQSGRESREQSGQGRQANGGETSESRDRPSDELGRETVDGISRGLPNGTPSGRADPGDSRQFVRELRARRQAAESLRADLRAMGQDVTELDRLMQRFRELENVETFGDVQGLDQLHEDVIEGLKTFEFALWRKFGEPSDSRPALGASARVPPRYRELVEEYYRSLARGKPARSR